MSFIQQRQDVICSSLMDVVAGLIVPARVTILLQTQQEHPDFKRPQHFTPYKGYLDGFARIIREEGFAALYRGNFAYLVKCVPAVLITLAMNVFFRGVFTQVVGSSINTSSNLAKYPIEILSGAATASVIWLLLNRLEYSRTRFAAEGPYRQFNSHLSLMFPFMTSAEYGSPNTGFYVTVLGQVVYTSALQALIHSRNKPFSLESFLLTHVAIAIAGLAAYPLDTIRRREMVRRPDRFNTTEYKGSMDCASKVIKQYGVSVLFSGALSSTVRTFISTSLTFLCLKSIRSFGTHLELSE
jgi:solute carrier family 25 (adenine nucleotide translocator) protein 4/5/6/31